VLGDVSDVLALALRPADERELLAAA